MLNNKINLKFQEIQITLHYLKHLQSHILFYVILLHNLVVLSVQIKNFQLKYSYIGQIVSYIAKEIRNKLFKFPFENKIHFLNEKTN